MQLKMSKNSLFAILMRSPWWVSLVVAFIVALLARLLLPEHLTPFALISGLPFLVIAGMAGFKQARTLSPARVTSILEAAAALSWKDFADSLEMALRRDGYTVTRLNQGGADFALLKEGRGGVLAAKRWKAVNQGVEPLRELQGAREKQGIGEAIYVASGNLSDNARSYAADHNIRLMQGPELAQLLRGLPLGGKAG